MKIGLLIDDKNLPEVHSDVCSWIYKNKKLSIELLIISNKKKIKNKKYSYIRIIEKILFKLISYLEKFLQSFDKKYNFINFNLKNYKFNEIHLDPETSKNGIFFSYKKTDIEKIKSKNLDLIIRMGSGILKGEILNCSKFGVISFHHGDNDFYRGDPPGFWEVYSKNPVTGFVIQKLNETIDGGDVIFKGHFPTQNYFYANKMFVYKKSIYYFKKVLNYMQENNSLPKIYSKKPYYNKLYKSPDIFEILKYVLNIYSFILIKIFKKVFLRKKSIYNVAFNNQNYKNNIIRQSNIIKNPKKSFSADPFLFKFENKTYLFVEEFCYKKNRGAIAVYLLDGNNYKRLGLCLDETFHLSFPYIFNFNNEIYMCPETSETKDIRIYKCLDFPLKWKFETIIMKNVSSADNMIFKKDELWWMFSNIDTANVDDHSSELSIFYSKDGPLTSSWIPHNNNPVICNPLKARNGGLIIEDKKFYRVNQKIGFTIYGKEFELNEIINLTENEYIEKKIFSIKPSFFKNISSTHHYHSDGTYTAIDFSSNNYLNLDISVNKFKQEIK